MRHRLVGWVVGVFGAVLLLAGGLALVPTPPVAPVVRAAPPGGATPSATPPCGLPGSTPWTFAAPQPQPARLVSLVSDGTTVYAAGGSSPNQTLDQFARYDPPTNTWTPLAPLLQGAEGITSIYAPNTGKLYLFGGISATTALTTTQVYDLATGQWTPGAPLPAPRAMLTGGYWQGKIYLTAGTNSVYFTPRYELWEYDPLADSWTTGLPNLPVATVGAGGGIINGHLYVASGANDQGQALPWSQDYDIAARRWTGRATVLHGAYGAGSAVVDGQLWLFGGGDLFAARRTPLRLDQAAPSAFTWTQIYDPFTDSWRAGSALNTARVLVGGTSVGSQVVAAGGLLDGADLASVEVATSLPIPRCPTVTPTPTLTGTPPTATATVTPTPTQCGIWGTIDPWTEIAGYPPAIRGPGLASDGQTILLAGGDAGFPDRGVGRTAQYDPIADLWTPRATMVLSRSYGALIYAPNVQRFYHFGGIYGTHDAQRDNQVYTPLTNSWQVASDLPAGRAYMTLAYAQGQIYLAGGSNASGFGPRSTLWAYDPVADTWNTNLPPLPARVMGAVVGVINGHLYVAGGADAGENPLTSLYDYDLSTQTWYTRTSMLQGVYAAMGATVGGRLWVIAGGTPFLGAKATDAPAAVALVQIYDPATDTWSRGPALPAPRSHGAGTQVGNRVYIFGGGDGNYTSHFLYTDWYPGVPCVTASATPSPTHTRTGTPSATRTRTASPTALTPTPSPPARTPTPTATACALTFSDVPSTQPFYPYIRCLACRGIVSGYADGTFAPGHAVTRGQLCKMAANAAGLTDPIPPTRQTFQDVPSAQPFWLFIERAAAHGWVTGYADGTFHPNAPLTRGQLAKIAASSAGYSDPIPGTQQTFADVPPADPFWLWVERSAAHGLVSGYGCNAGPGNPCTGLGEGCPGSYYRPCAGATRGQTAKIVATAFFPACVTP